MRIVTARMNHETNTFSPVPTPLAAFAPLWGEDARRAADGSQTAMGAFLAFAAARGASLATPVFAMANPSGPVEDAAFEAMADAIVREVAAGCDAVLLDLHGAMVTQSLEDGEGELVARVRAVAPNVPIGVALDLHGNVTLRLVGAADVLVGFKTYPHVDMRQTGDHVARLIGRMLDEGLRPCRALVHPPMLGHTLAMNTAKPGAMRDAIAAAAALESQGHVLAATIFGGFPLADIPEAGMSAVVVAERQGAADEAAEALSALLWKLREGFVHRDEPMSNSLGRVRAALARPGDGPVLVLDHGDNCMSGGTCDTMDVIEAVLAAGFDNILAGPICDPEAVETLAEAGVGATVTLALGNRTPLPLIATRQPVPHVLTGTVAALGSGDYVISGPTYTGMRCAMGRTAVLDTGRARILIAETPHEPWDLAVFESIGLDPRAASVLVLKSRMYCRPVFEPLSKAVVECASLGVTSSDYALFDFKRVMRPIYPIDPKVTWRRDADRA